MIGLKRGIAKVVPYNAIWEKNFDIEKKKLMKCFSQKEIVAVEHMGSTAVPRLSAKPIIDIALGIDRFRNAHKVVVGLKSLGYIWKPDANKRYEWLFVKGDDAKQTHYAHLVTYDGQIWKRYIKFRDILRSNKKILSQYKKLKEQLASKHAGDRKSYTGEKRKFISSVLS